MNTKTIRKIAMSLGIGLTISTIAFSYKSVQALSNYNNTSKIGEKVLTLNFENEKGYTKTSVVPDVNIDYSNKWYKNTDGKWYFYNENGLKAKGWNYISNKWYLLDYITGEMLTGLINDNNKLYFLDDNGAMQTGWKSINNQWYYFQKDGSAKIGWLKDGSLWYYLKSDGSMATGWLKDSGKWYYMNNSGVMQTGWLKDGSLWYYLKSDGSMATGWLKDSGKWYYMNNSGVMQTGWLKDGSSWYYLQSNGAMATGWIKVSNQWYYLYNDGKMATNCTIDGWRIDGNGVATKIEIPSNGESSNNGSIEDNTIVYTTPGGKSYHKTKDCVTLKRSTIINKVTLSQAKKSGKDDPCNVCNK